MNKQEYIDTAEENLFHVYNRFPVVFDKGEGVNIYDTDGKKYLDFASGIGVMAFGYGNEEYKDALKNQIDKITHTSNLYYHVPMIEAGKKVCKASGMDKIFFTNSGAEAIEGAIKTAKRYAYNRDGYAGHEIIAMEHSFHGRTVGSLSVTGTEHYREPFLPLMEGVRFAQFNDINSVIAQLSDKTCAIIMETVQGEGGLYPADPEFIKAVRKLCDERDMLLILDEIQCGMGRTGSMYAFQQYGVKPDILTSAKALGAGVPVGAFLVTDKVASNSLVPGDHGTTYGGNPLVCAAVDKTMDIMTERKIPEHVAELTPYFESVLDKIVEKYDFVTSHRGMGFMQGLVLSEEVAPGKVVAAALEHGLVILSAGKDVVRLLPPLVIEKSDIDEMYKLLTEVLDTFVK
ncbi:MAG: aspartate aminotransferase family protein [Lachnospiraceae bacterium]|nr:aspartate aminotransferase family protein [Lachnospiraceae bacterium]